MQTAWLDLSLLKNLVSYWHLVFQTTPFGYIVAKVFTSSIQSPSNSSRHINLKDPASLSHHVHTHRTGWRIHLPFFIQYLRWNDHKSQRIAEYIVAIYKIEFAKLNLQNWICKIEFTKLNFTNSNLTNSNFTNWRVYKQRNLFDLHQSFKSSSKVKKTKKGIASILTKNTFG